MLTENEKSKSITHQSTTQRPKCRGTSRKKNNRQYVVPFDKKISVLKFNGSIPDDSLRHDEILSSAVPPLASNPLPTPPMLFLHHITNLHAQISHINRIKSHGKRRVYHSSPSKQHVQTILPYCSSHGSLVEASCTDSNTSWRPFIAV